MNIFGVIITIVGSLTILTIFFTLVFSKNKNFKLKNKDIELSVENEKTEKLNAVELKEKTCDDSVCTENKFSTIFYKIIYLIEKFRNIKVDTIRLQMDFADEKLLQIEEIVSTSIKKAEVEKGIKSFITDLPLVMRKMKDMCRSDFKNYDYMNSSESDFISFRKEKANHVMASIKKNIPLSYMQDVDMYSKKIEMFEREFKEKIEPLIEKILDQGRVIALQKKQEKIDLNKEIDDFCFSYTGERGLIKLD